MFTLKAMARSFRHGQVQSVHIYRLVVAGSFEEVMLNQQIVKRQLAARVVDGRTLVNTIRRSECTIFPDAFNSDSVSSTEIELIEEGVFKADSLLGELVKHDRPDSEQAQGSLSKFLILSITDGELLLGENCTITAQSEASITMDLDSNEDSSNDGETGGATADQDNDDDDDDYDDSYANDDQVTPKNPRLLLAAEE